MRLPTTKILASTVLAGTLAALLGFAVAANAAERYYRYTNEEGVTVINSRIPPEYVKNGYEVVTVSGHVLSVVPPAPSAEEAAAREREAELAERDTYLLRRYSSTADIEAAKARKLADFDASMSILRGNANNLQSQIDTVQARAADLERAGREIPEILLENLKTLQAQYAKAQQLIETRLLEKEELEERFDAEIDRFATIKPAS